VAKTGLDLLLGLRVDQAACDEREERAARQPEYDTQQPPLHQYRPPGMEDDRRLEIIA
jgi:hypothetical protein